MASPQAEARKALLVQMRGMLGGGGQPMNIDEQRARMAGAPPSATVPEGVTTTETYAGGCRALWHDPEGGAKDRVILYFHGGGYVLGSHSRSANAVSHIAKAVGCRALNVDYRLAPEHPFPAAVDDALAAYRWLLAQGMAAGHIAISGDSAGGGLTLAALLAIMGAGLPLPAAAVPLSAWTDMEGTGDSMRSKAEADLIISDGVLAGMAGQYLGEQDPKDPLASPLHGDYQGLPPLYLQVGGDEALLDDSTRVAERARAAGVEAKLDIFPEMQHVFQNSAGNVPEADEAIARIGAWLRPRLGLA
jgi:acetyl esterase/lipase